MWVQVVKQPTVISLFAGCGGSSLGYKLAGFKELLAVEWDDNAIETFKLNFPDVPVYHGDICKLTSKECMKLAGIKVGELDILDGSPPCQGFSTAGKRKFNDSRNDLFKEFVRLLRDLQPKVFVFENVSGLVKGYMKQIYLEIMKGLRDCGYNCKGSILNTMYFNVPQSRERVIIIGVRNNLGIEPSHPKPGNVIPVCECPEVEDKPLPLVGIELRRFNHIPPGGNWQDLPKYLINGKAKYSNFHRRLHPLKPSFTIGKEEHYSSGRFYHWSEPRRISNKELQFIGSYPLDFIFIGDEKIIHSLIGNSVPPLFMKAIAEHIRDNILEMAKERDNDSAMPTL